MIKLYDSVLLKEKNVTGHIIEIDDSDITRPPYYLVEIDDANKGDYNDVADVLVWCEWRDFEELSQY